ncbi:MAG: phage Gp37/Gp68 family protein [Candidatus Sulfotelmatobacter sp.]
MSENSKIEWTDTTWNPLRGCTKISPGCKHCYAETFAERFRGVPGHPYEQGFDLRLVPEKLSEPFLWSSPRTVFVNSMSDLFQPEVPDAYIEDVVRVMVEANWHTYQVLTKRSERLMDMINGPLRFAAHNPHIWWGVSVEDKRYGLPRVKHLRKAPATVKFLSIEPLLEDLGSFDISGIDWVIVGGESGHGARRMKQEWVENVLRICRDGKVAFFFKQWGGVHKTTRGRRLHRRTYDEMPKVHPNPIPSRRERSTAATLWDQRSTRWAYPSNTSPLIFLQPAVAV